MRRIEACRDRAQAVLAFDDNVLVGPRTNAPGTTTTVRPPNLIVRCASGMHS
jgi:hypothetical protein